MSEEEKPNLRKLRGFGSMTPEQRKEFASRGGKASHAAGKGHKFTSEEARRAGLKGQQIARQRRQNADQKSG